jgi:redox-sensitive bicupin YhaK (pirin superfamily)
VHHDDRYPAGNAQLGPDASLAGRHLGSDFGRKDGWSMYHGQEVPGFPRHPHRGFETVSVVRRGLVDHADSLGAAARYGDGDVQWLTAGDGIIHAEMFPLLRSGAANPIDFFQIWLNLPARNKRVAPHFAMFWSDTIPVVSHKDAAGRVTQITVIAGRYGARSAPEAPPSSWAAAPENDVAIWTVKMAPGAEWTLPAGTASAARSLYLVRGDGVKVGSREIANFTRLSLKPAQDLGLINGSAESELLLLQGRPIGEPVVHHGPFVMNTREEIQEAYRDYNQTQFGGWPWTSDAPTHGDAYQRFARRADGSTEQPA